MKKIWKVTASTLAMAFCFTGLFACDGDDKKETDKGGNGVISGNYTEVTSEKQKNTLAEKIAMIDTDNLLGDTDAADWAKGVTLSWENDIDIAWGEDKVDTEGNGALNLYVNKKDGQKNVFDFAASMNMTQSLTASQGMSKTLGLWDGTSEGDAKLKLDETVYADPSNIYLNTALTTQNIAIESMTRKDKVSISDIGVVIEGLMGAGPMVTAAALDPETVSEVTMLLSMLEGFKVDVSVDYSDGLKIKLETSDQTWSLLKTYIVGMMGGTELMESTEEEDVAMTWLGLLDYIELDAELYVHFAKSGELKAFAVKLDVGMDAEVQAGMAIKADVELSFNLSVHNKKVTLPSGLATDESYKPLDLPALLDPFINGPSDGDGQVDPEF